MDDSSFNYDNTKYILSVGKKMTCLLLDVSKINEVIIAT